ncbi:MAG: tRNA preQ1(34) S-adenosylmethionine ribosyltransferase-isomerase QueA [Lachnospiraceae bacterium]|jgi:S-adenosylmethionine:tRNA ribosyltransferase-isomerase|nr:tRNA preQ1(34) S-adenosylmethionine ribosyltransferase-isomerase QueA [Lachnospiraceae bacterium]
MSEIIRTKDYWYELPQELIAQEPLGDRTASRLLLLDKESGVVRHDAFRNIARYLNPGDCLVLNDSKVIPARLYGKRQGSGAAVEVLLLRRLGGDTWEALVKPGKKCRTGVELVFGAGVLTGVVNDVLDNGNRLIAFSYQGIFTEVLDALGEMPTPPYITQKLLDKNRYQTVYARHDGSAAAPTAGLHFTDELLKEIAAKGVRLAYITLHVGLGTFRPVKCANAADHHMHSEHYEIPPETAVLVNRTKAAGGRVVCVGTTSCRALESGAKPCLGEKLVYYYVEGQKGDTDIFIYPGYGFKITDALITNFHLPESTLLMLVAAMAGRERALAAYAEAVRKGYRFFSFGDAMLII